MYMQRLRTSSSTLALLFLMSLLFVLVALMQFENVSEWWTITIARFYHLTFAWLFSLVPFSLMEIIVVTWGVVVVIHLIKSIRFAIEKQTPLFLKSLQYSLITLLIMTNLYVATAGMAYRRQPVMIPQFEGEVLYTEYVSIVDYFADRFNEASTQLSFNEETGSVINPYSLDELNDIIGDAFLLANLDTTYFTTYSTKVKPLLTSFLYREFQIIGVHFAPSTEATINILIPDALIPYTMIHELVHAKGVMREDDANLVALYVCLLSDNPYLQYSGYFNTFYALLNLTRYMGDSTAYGRAFQRLNPSIRADYQFQGVYWANYDVLDTFARWVNDTYLRLFGTDGVSSYTDVPTIITIDDGENTIEVIDVFSPYQKLFFYQYFIWNAS
jgi:hypothetical protein